MQTPVADIDPQEILQRSALANQQVESAAFTIEASYNATEPEGIVTASAELDGVLHHTTRLLQSALTARYYRSEPKQSYALIGNIIASSNDGMYMQVASWEDESETPMIQPGVLNTFQNQWVHLPPATDTGAVTTTLTPDPALIRAQVEVVSVSEHLGLSDINGRHMHHLHAALETEKFIAFLQKIADEKQEQFEPDQIRSALAPLNISGELWIDAETYLLHRARWNINHSDSQYGYTAQIDTHISDHNGDNTVVLPKEVVPLSTVLSAKGDAGDTVLDLPIEGDFVDNFDELTEEEQQQLLQYFLQESP